MVLRLVIILLCLAMPGIGATKKEAQKTVLFLGDSLTAGYGLDKVQAFPELIQQKINALDWPFEVINAGLSGETSSGGLRRINWLLKRKFDVMVMELGANDALRGVPLDVTRENLQKMIDLAKETYPQIQIVIAGMEAPPNMGEDYTDTFRTIFKDLAQQNGATLIPFLLEGVAGNPQLNLPDRIHPTPEGHQKVAENIWAVLKPVLRKLIARPASEPVEEPQNGDPITN